MPVMLGPLYARLGRTKLKKKIDETGIFKCKKLPKVTKYRCLLKKCFRDLLLNLFSQEQGTQGNEKKQQFAKEY